MFDIAVALFIFKRVSGLEPIIGQLRKIKPSRIYLIADGPRNEEEAEACFECRKKAEELIDWDCDVIKNYAEKNRGVYNNIGNGALWVFEHEEKAIFLEDDNYPEITFFDYCKQLLEKYADEEKILWICGTNYMGQSDMETSYVFTKHLLPCGWASWAEKFKKHYDGELKGLSEKDKTEAFKASFMNRALYKQQLHSVERTKYLLDSDKKKSSWDYQMLFSLRANGLYGIAPKYNQIKNIGADSFSIHGGVTMNNTMTSRFCLVETYPLEFPLVAPDRIEIDKKFESETGKIILYPLNARIKVFIGGMIKRVLRINKNESLSVILREKKNYRKGK